MGDAAQDIEYAPGSMAKKKKILIGAPTGLIGALDFDANNPGFTLVANSTINGTSPSWMAFQEPNRLYAVDENTNTTRLFNFDPDTNELKLVQNATGSSGVVSLAFTQDKSIMVGAAYGQGQIDVWDISAEDGSLKLLKQIPAGGTLGPVTGRQDSPHPHQILLDPTGQFFVSPDLGTDSLIVIDSTNFEIANRIAVTPAGSGPRHGAFFPLGAKQATHFILVCELANLVKVFELKYTDTTLEFTEIQSLSSYGAEFPPADPSTALAGELVIDTANKNVYVSNRLSGNETDSISHFSINIDDAEPLTFADQISSGGIIPRMFSLSVDESILFSSNQDGESGLLAFSRDPVTGSLTEEPLASISRATFGPANAGPQYVMEIGSTGSNA